MPNNPQPQALAPSTSDQILQDLCAALSTPQSPPHLDTQTLLDWRESLPIPMFPKRAFHDVGQRIEACLNAVGFTRTEISDSADEETDPDKRREALANNIVDAYSNEFPEDWQKRLKILQLYTTHITPILLPSVDLDAFAKSVEFFHLVWNAALKNQNDLKHPIAPLVKAWYEDWEHENNAKHITRKYDQQRPAAIIDRQNMGSIRDFAPRIEPNGEAKIITKPESQLVFDFLPTSPLPDVLPIHYFKVWDIRKEKFASAPHSRRGIIAMPIRLAFETLMAMGQNSTRDTIRWLLGDLMCLLNPDGKFHRTNFLPVLLNGLHALDGMHIVHYENPDNEKSIGFWKPFAVRRIPDTTSGDESNIIIEADLMPFTGGMLVSKNPIRLTGKRSSPQFNAYLTACYLFDKYGTVKGKLIAPTRPIGSRNADNHLIDPTGKVIVTQKGAPVSNIFHPSALALLDRAPNPARDKYPVLSDADLIKACYPSGYKKLQHAKYLTRAKKAWCALETMEVVCIEKLSQGWRIMPGNIHLGHHRGVRRTSTK